MEDIKYITSNIWGRFKPKKFTKIQGVEVRVLPEDHKIPGQHGLFATQKWDPYDVIGEYVGKIVDDNFSTNKYVADLYISSGGSSLGIDALENGNEMRYINDYRGISSLTNCQISKATVDRRPILLIIATRSIDIGEEILMDYGDGYWGKTEPSP